MDPATTARNIQRREGWSDTALLGLLLEFVRVTSYNDALSDYLEARSS